ncbi:hypothetical protein [Streptomyces sp. NPDC017673]|uniref:hypothetical protein n=1 Tax=unclassified Streptomyces TaxID=2593676 RepID=UPI003791F0B9
MPPAPTWWTPHPSGLGRVAVEVVATGVDRHPSGRRRVSRGRHEAEHWGRLPDISDEGGHESVGERRPRLRRRFRNVLGERRNPRVVPERSGCGTVPTSPHLFDSGGMVVSRGGTTGYDGDVGLRSLWMRQRRPPSPSPSPGTRSARSTGCAEARVHASGRASTGLPEGGRPLLGRPANRAGRRAGPAEDTRARALLLRRAGGVPMADGFLGASGPGTP